MQSGKQIILFACIGYGLSLCALADDLPKATTAKPVAADQLKAKNKEREANYDKAGMSYAKGLWQSDENTNQDDKRSKTAEGLSYTVRARAIKITEAQLSRAKNNPKLKQEIYYRLGMLEEQQSESAGRKAANGSSVPLFQQHVRKAISWQEKSLHEFPKYRADELLYALGENYSHLQELRKAETYYKRLCEQYKDSKLLPDALLAIGNLYFDRKSYVDARKFFGQILLVPEKSLHAYAHYKMAWCWFNERRYPEAMSSLEHAVELSQTLGNDKQQRRLGVEDEALSDLVLFYSEYSNPNDAKSYFERVVGEVKARDLRVLLAKRYFDQGQHENAKLIARGLLKEDLKPKAHGELLLVLLSVAEKTKDLSLSLATAKELTKWVSELKFDPNDPIQTESEEYIRSYCLRAHYTAETIKKPELWQHAKLAYETYLGAFTKATEAPEIRFRYGGLLFQMHKNALALQSLKQAIAVMKKDAPRFKEALQLRIQTIEQASKAERKEIPDVELIIAYDEFVKAYPDEKLAPEAAFKSAELAKKLETPEQVAARFRAVAVRYPQNALAKSAVTQSLATLVQGGRWSALKMESAALTGKMDDKELQTKISEVKELAEVKLIEEMEQKGQFKESRNAYDKLLDQKFSQNFEIMCLVKAAHLAEQKLQDPSGSIKYWEELQKRYSETKEAQGANLEMARIYDQLKKPEKAVAYYLAYAKLGTEESHNQALTNAAVLTEKLHDRVAAANYFDQLYRRLSKKKGKDAAQALEASCNNYLLATYQNKSSDVFGKLRDCAGELSKGSDGPRWLARSAWALEQLNLPREAAHAWRELGSLKAKHVSDELKPYIGIGKLKNLEGTLAEFKTLRFTGANEKPTANIGKKTKALDSLEHEAQAVIAMASPGVQIAAQKIIQQAYVEFAETMEAAAVPKKLSDEEKTAMKASFQAAAAQLRDKAKSMAIPELTPAAVHAPASAAEESMDPVAKQYF